MRSKGASANRDSRPGSRTRTAVQPERASGCPAPPPAWGKQKSRGAADVSALGNQAAGTDCLRRRSESSLRFSGERVSRVGQIGRAAGRGSGWSSDVCSSDLAGQRTSRRWGTRQRGRIVCADEVKAACVSPAKGSPESARSEERRVGEVAGVQTCALPISRGSGRLGVGEPGSGDGLFAQTK